MPANNTATAQTTASAILGDLRGFAREGGDELRRALRLIDGHVRVAVLDQLQARVRERFRQPLGVAQLEEAVLRGPGQQHGLVELAEAPRGLLRMARRDPAQDGGDLAPDLPV